MSDIPYDIVSKTQQAINTIYSTHKVGVSISEKRKSLIKYGKNALVGTTKATIMQLPAGILDETYLADNSNIIDSISTTDASASGLILVEGHTMTNGKRVFVSQKPILNGQNEVNLTTPLNRINRIRKIAGSTVLADSKIVYVYDNTGVTLTAGVPDVDAQVHCMMDSIEGSSLKAATSLSNDDFWIIQGISLGVNKKQAASVDFRFEVREVGGDFITLVPPVTLSSTGLNSIVQSFPVYLVVPRNADVRLTAISSAAGTEVTGGLFGVLAKIVKSGR